ncbi:MAG: dephospho-CoA kinase [Clostridia bacterium]|nr:dephospho-CoA kinase [Clostridia bacterium]
MTQNRNLLIAITGGIGSGKSTVSKILKDLGYTVYSADETYAELLVCNEFVNDIHRAVGVTPKCSGLDRKAVSSAVFSSPEKLKALNEVTHPKIMKELLKKSSGKGVVFNEVPLLFEGGYEKYYNAVIVVVRPEQERIKAVSVRSGITEEEVKNRIKNQFDYEKLNKVKHTIIVNDSSVESLAKKVESVLNEIL